MEIIITILFYYGIYRIGKKIYEQHKQHKKKVEDFNSSDYKKNANVEFYEMVSNTGTKGEYILYKYLDENITGNKKIINNVYLEKNNVKTTEIDIILLCNKGIFVFEVKNYNGWIFGSREQIYWQQRFESGVRYKFYNPIMQNAGHIKALKEYLNISKKGIMKSIVIFIGEATIKSEIEYVKNSYVLDGNLSTIKNIVELSENVLTDSQINDIYNKLIIKTGKTRKFKQEHINNINIQYFN